MISWRNCVSVAFNLAWRTRNFVDMPDKSAASIRLPDTEDLPAPQAVNFFTFAWNSGVEVQLLAGYVDLLDLRAKAKDAEVRGEVCPQITHRLFMSMRGFAQLRAQVLEASQILMTAGVNLDELNPMVKQPEKK
jgi:hypothetical protein